jgi:glutamine amidotransferase
MTVTLINYGMGNLWSVQTAVEKLGYSCLITSDPAEVAAAQYLILPGVGSFNLAMNRLRDLELDQAIHQSLQAGAKILGICLGMQLMCRSSTEDGFTEGLGLVDVPVDRIWAGDASSGLMTHVGFNTVRFSGQSRLAGNLGEAADFYFVHSYCAMPADVSHESTFLFAYATLRETPIVAAFESDRVFGVQFHPEKSQANGLCALANFLNPEG